MRRIGATGADVLDWSSDADHGRSVVTFVGDPATVEAAALVTARFALERIDLTRHRGVHPRVGALDVLPFVPLQGLTMADARRVARRVGGRIADELGVPVYWYGAASDAGRRLADIRRGGFETLAARVPAGREPDLPAGRDGLHPTAGAVCVGARRLLLAWNVYVEGVALDDLRSVAADLRELGAGRPPPPSRFTGLRALAFELSTQGRLQISMNLEDLEATSPFDVYRAIEGRVTALGGRVGATEVIGMIPDPLVLPAAADRLHLLESHSSRLLSARVADHVSNRASRAATALLDAIEAAGAACPPEVREAAQGLQDVTRNPTPGDGS